MMIRAAAITAAFAALWAFPAAAAETPLAALECDPVNEWVAAGAAPTVRTLANHHGWSAFEAVRGKDRRYVLSHPPDDGESTLPPWGNLDAPAEGACYLFRETVRTKVPKAGSFGPKGGTHSARVFVDESCSDESCAYLMVGLDASGTATSTVVLTTRVVNVERISVFDGHDSLLVTAETDAGAGYRHVLKAIVHDSGAGLAPLLTAETGVHEEQAQLVSEASPPLASAAPPPFSASRRVQIVEAQIPDRAGAKSLPGSTHREIADAIKM